VLPESERRAYTIEHSYHTTLAAAMAGFTVGPLLEQSSQPHYRGCLKKAAVEASRSDEWRLVAARAETWFASLLQYTALSVQQHLQVLIGLWLTNHHSKWGVDIEPNSLLWPAVRWTTTALRTLNENANVLAGIDIGLLLCGAGILRSLGNPDPLLEQFALQLGQHLPASREPLSLDVTIQLASARHLLATLSYTSWINPPGHEEMAAFCSGHGPDLFRVDDPTQERLTKALLAASAFGHLSLQGLDEAIRLAVPVWALTSLKRHQLDRGALLLRASNSLCPAGDPSIAAGVAFLMMQQRADGAFGFLAPEAEEISGMHTNFRPELEMTLPITVAAVWCLAEVLTPDVRLYPTPGTLVSTSHKKPLNLIR
jgi:hypothetical protein